MWATTRHDVYLMSYYSVLHWSALTREKQEIIDLQGHVAPCEVQGFSSKHVFQSPLYLMYGDTILILFVC